jgi:hypothetical protein
MMMTMVEFIMQYEAGELDGDDIVAGFQNLAWRGVCRAITVALLRR